MREVKLALFLLLRSLLLDLKSSGILFYRLLFPLVLNSARQPLAWFVITLAAILYLSLVPIVDRWSNRDTGRSFLLILFVYPLAELAGKMVASDLTTLSIKRHLSWLAEIEDVVHEFNVIRSLNAKELREFGGDFTLAEIQMRMAESQDRMVETMGGMAVNLPAGTAPPTGEAQPLNLAALANTVLLIIWGTQGGGKTTIAKLIAQYRESHGHTITIADPHGSTQEWGTWRVIGSGRNYKQINAYLQDFDDLITKDYQRYSEGKRDFSYSTLLVDEFTQWADRCNHSASFVKSACSDLRKLRRCVILITHSDTITGLGNAKGLRESIDRSAVKLQLETRLNSSGEYEPTGYGWLQYPGQEKERVRIPQTRELTLPAATTAPVEVSSDLGFESELLEYFSSEESQQIDVENMTEDQINELIDRMRTNKPDKTTPTPSDLSQDLFDYCSTKGARFADLEGWMPVSKLQQNWGKPHNLDARQFKIFLNNLTQLGLGQYHPENLDLWQPIPPES